MDLEQLVFMLLVVNLLPSVIVGLMAKPYQRSTRAWFFLAMAFTAPVAFVFLLVAGFPNSGVVRNKKEEWTRTQHPERVDVSGIAQSELTCSQCGATINPVTGDALHSPEEEP